MLKDRKVFEKIEKDRKRNCLVLVLKFLLDNGYVEALTKLEQESTCSLSQWALADNMSLPVVVAEFETYHEIKFGSIPMISKKLGPDEYGPPDMKKGSTKLQGSGSRLPPMKPSPTPAVTKATAPPTKQTAGTPTTAAGTSKGSNGSFQLEIEGEGVDLSKKPKDKDPMAGNEDYFSERVLKGIPEFYMHNAELRELAMSLQRDIIIQNPKVGFKEIVGLEDAKRVLREAVRLPTLFPQFFTGALEPWRGALLFGPPGTGKTLLAKAVASECRTIFFNISASSLVSKWQGESEKMVRVLFDLARHHQPSTIFLDEIDSIMSQRAGSNQHEGSRRLKTELLIQMDGLARGTERVFVLAASNLPWDLDNALLRRLEKRIYVPLPSKESREAMLRQFIPNNSIPGVKNELDYSALSARMDGFSGSDIKSLCKEALMKPLRRLFKSLELPDGSFREAPAALKPELVSASDFEEALQCTRPSPSTADAVYKEYFAKFGAN